MVMSLISRLTGKSKAKSDSVVTPDLSRVSQAAAGEKAERPKRAVAGAETVDVSVWMNADLERLSETWEALTANPENGEAEAEFNRAIHNLHGASGAYGGGALTRLSGSLQRLVTESVEGADNTALINMHVQACRAAALDSSSDEIANAVCDALENQVERSVAATA